MKIWKALAVITSSLALIMIGVIGVGSILLIFPLVAIFTEPLGGTFFVGGAVAFYLTFKVLKGYLINKYPGKELLLAHVALMITGVILFDWRFVCYLVFILIYSIPVLLKEG